MRLLLAVILVSFWSSSIAWAEDLVILKGGREIKGQITSETESHVDINTDYGKQLHIHKTRILNMVRSGEQRNDAGAGGGGQPFEASAEPNRGASGHSNKGVMAGILLGGAFSNASNDPAPTTSPTSRTSIMIGVVGDVPLTDMFYLQPELSYAGLGFKSSATVTEKLDFMTVPLLFKIKYALGSDLHLAGLLGPSIGFRIKAERDTNGTVTDVSTTYKSMTYGIDLGAGAEYQFTTSASAFFNLRYSLGLADILDDTTTTTSTKLKHFDVLAGVLFRI